MIRKPRMIFLMVKKIGIILLRALMKLKKYAYEFCSPIVFSEIEIGPIKQKTTICIEVPAEENILPIF